MNFTKKNSVTKVFSIQKIVIVFYFLIGFIEVFAIVYLDDFIQYLIKPVLVVLLSIMYWTNSNKRSSLFFINLLFLLIGRFYLIPNDYDFLFYALIAVVFHRIIEIYYISKLIKLKDFIPTVIASIPFLFLFLYLVSIHEDFVLKSFVILMIQIVLISVLSGIILSHYVLTFDKKDVWLYIFGLMSLMQTFIVFIEKFYLSDLQLTILRPSSLLLNTIICFSFYKFVIESENLNND